MPENLDPQLLINARASVENAKRVREIHARRTARTSAQRIQDVNVALARLKDAMKPIRSEIGRFPYGPDTDAAEGNRALLRQWSTEIQRQRRKLWKMIDNPKEDT